MTDHLIGFMYLCSAELRGAIMDANMARTCSKCKTVLVWVGNTEQCSNTSCSEYGKDQ